MHRLQTRHVRIVKRVSLSQDVEPRHRITMTIDSNGDDSTLNVSNNGAVTSGSEPPAILFRSLNVPPILMGRKYYKQTEKEAHLLDAMVNVCNNPEAGALTITGRSGIGITTTLAHLLKENEVKIGHNQSLSDNAILVFWVDCSRYRDFEEDEEKMEQLFHSDLVHLARSLDPTFDGTDPSQIASYFKAKTNCRVLFVFDDLSRTLKLNQQNSPPVSCCVVASDFEQLRNESGEKRVVEVLEEMSDADVKNMLETVHSMKGKLPPEKLAKLAKCCCGLPLIANLIAACSELGADTWNFDTFMSDVGMFQETKLDERQLRIVAHLFQSTVNQLHHQWRRCYYSFLMFNPGEDILVGDLELFWSRYSLVSSNLITEFLEARSLVIARSPDRTQLAIHPLLYEAALETASKEFQLSESEDRLQHLRLRLLTSAAEGEIEMILFAVIRSQRLHLLKRIISKVNAENLAQLCKKLSADQDKGANQTLLQFLYKFKWQNAPGSINPSYILIREILLKMMKRLTSKEVLNVVNTPSEDGSSSFLTDLLDDEMLEQQPERQPLVMLLNRWRLVYINQCWRRVLIDGDKKRNKLLMAVLQDEPEETAFPFDEADEKEVKEAFLAAARCNRLDMVERIYQAVRDNPEKNEFLGEDDLETAMMFASAAGYLDVVKFLCENSQRGASTRDSDGRTPLFMASENGHLEVVEFLYEKDETTVKLPDNSGRTPLWASAHNGNLNVAKFLCEKFEDGLYLQDANGTTPLWIAALNGHFQVVAFLYERIQAASRQDTSQTTPFWAASANGQIEIVRFLGEQSVEVDDGKFVSLPDPNGGTPMWIAARHGHFEVVKYIYKKDKQSVSVADNTGTTPLWNAAGGGYLDIVKFLCDKDETCILQKNNNGMTPLWVAAARGHLEVVKFLYEKDHHGATIPEIDGFDPLTIAQSNEHYDVVEFLKNVLNESYKDKLSSNSV